MPQLCCSAGLPQASQRRHQECTRLQKQPHTTACLSWPCLKQASADTMTCTRLQNKRMAHLCCERKKCLAYRSQRRHHVMCPVVKADACNNMNQLCGDEGWPCQKQAGVGIVTCARLQEQPHVRASMAVSRENVAVAKTMPAVAL